MNSVTTSIMAKQPLPSGEADTRIKADLARLREATGKIVGSVFFGAMLKSVRESGMKGRYGHGGRGEEVFASQLHGVLAERAGVSAPGGLADALFRRLESQQIRIGRTQLADGAGAA